MGDGNSHPLSDFYNTLADAQADYPHAVALTDELAWAAMVALFNSLKAHGGGHGLIPNGTYLISGQMGIWDAVNITISGAGNGTVLMPTADLATNMIEVSGSKNLQFEDFSIDGSLMASVPMCAFYGDGTADNNTYGNIRVKRIRILNWLPQTFGIGVNDPYTVEDVTIEDCYLENCGCAPIEVDSFNAIDTGSSGTKRRYKIRHNRIVYTDSFPTTIGNAIFCGHGTNYDYEISDNVIDNAPTNGIQLYGRPFTIGETTTHKGSIVTGNQIRNPGWSGISILGCDDVVLANNTIINAGYSSGPYVEQRSAILLADRWSGNAAPTPPYYSSKQLAIGPNVIVDNQLSPTMRYGIYEARFAGSTDTCTGQITNNVIIGATDGDMLTLGGMYLQRLIGTQVAIGAQPEVSTVTVSGDSHNRPSVGSDLFIQSSVESATAAADYLLGQGISLRWNGTNWISGFDGVSNAWGAILLDYGSGILTFLVGQNTGGAAQTISPASLMDHRKMQVDAGNKQITFVANQSLILGEASADTELSIRKDAAIGLANLVYKLSHRANGTDLLLYSNDGLSDINWVFCKKSSDKLVLMDYTDIKSDGTVTTTGKVTGSGLKATGLAGTAQPAKITTDGDLAKGPISLDTAEVNSSMTVGTLAQVDAGGKLKSFAGLAASRVMVTNGSGIPDVLSALSASLPMATDSGGMPTTSTYLTIYNEIKDLIDGDFVSNTDASTYWYTKSEIDTLLSAKTNDSEYSSHTHTVSDHTHGGVTAGTDSTSSGGSGSTSTP